MAVLVAELEAKVTADTGDFDSAMTASGQKVDALGAKGKAAGANFGAASAAMAAGAVGITAGIADAVMMAGNFEAAMNGIQAVTGATASEMEDLSAVALQVGQDTAFSAQEGAEAISELGKAGIPIADIINGAAMATANLAAAGGVDMPRAAEVMSNAMNSFGIAGTDAADVADTLAGAANASASDINSLAMGLSQVAPSARGLGLSLEETVAQLALFSNYGMQGSDAGTSMKTMLSSLTPSTDKARSAFAELGLSTAETANAFFDAQGQFVGMEQASNLLYEALAPLTDEQRAMALETIFGSDASRAAEITFQAQKAAVEGTAEGYGAMLEAVQANGQATEVANAKMAGMNGALEALSGSIDTAKIAFGMAFLPVVELVAEKLAELVNVFIGLDPQIQTVISAVAAGTAAFLAIGSAVGFIIGPLGAFLGVLAPIAAGVAAIAAPLLLVVGALALLYAAYQTNFLGFADGVNAVAGTVVASFQAISDFVTGTLLPAIQTGFAEGGIGGAVTAGLQVVSDAIMTWLNEQSANILNAFNEIDWTAVAATLYAGVSGAIAALGSFAEFLLTKGGELLGGLLQGIQDKWPDISAWLGTVGSLAVAAVPDVVATLLQKGVDLMAGLLQGIADKWPEVSTFMMNLAEAVLGAVPDLLTTLLQKGIDLLQGLWQGLQDKWPDVSAWLGTVGSLAVTAIGDLLTTLLQKGLDLITGLFQGITDKWPEVVTWFEGLPAAILSAIGDLGSILFDAGASLIQGFIDGIGSMASAVSDAIAATLPGGSDVSGLGYQPGRPSEGPSGGGQGTRNPGSADRRAAGGPVSAFQSYWVGEHGAELFTPSRSGQIVPHGASMAMAGAGRGGDTYMFQPGSVVLQDGEDWDRFFADKERQRAISNGRGV